MFMLVPETCSLDVIRQGSVAPQSPALSLNQTRKQTARRCCLERALGRQTRNPQPQSGIGVASYRNHDGKGSKILFERGPVTHGSGPGIGEVMADSSKPTAELRRHPDPNEKLVKIFDTEQESEAMVVKSLLESAVHAHLITGLSAPRHTLPGMGGTIIPFRGDNAQRA